MRRRLGEFSKKTRGGGFKWRTGGRGGEGTALKGGSLEGSWLTPYRGGGEDFEERNQEGNPPVERQ